GVKVIGNYIGTNAAGSAAIPNASSGISITDGTTNNIGGTLAGSGNVISGNTGPGITLGSGADSNLVQGNFIGTNAAGSAALGNGGGVVISGASLNDIGGTTTSARNIISGNTGLVTQGTGHGLMITGSGSVGNTIEGNYIGVDVTGSVAVPNVRSGVFI